MMNACDGTDTCLAKTHIHGCKTAKKLGLSTYDYRHGNGDALSNREAEFGSPEYDWLHRYDSPDNSRDTMG
jgi:hypothetical protein